MRIKCRRDIYGVVCGRFQLFSRTAVEFLVDLAKAFVGNVRINLGGGDVRVSQQGLHRTNIRAVSQKISGKPVP